MRAPFKPFAITFAAVVIIFGFQLFWSKRNKPESKIQKFFGKIIPDTPRFVPPSGSLIPALLIKKTEKDSVSVPMRISKIKLNVEVTGNIASTIMDITFYNDLDRVLDGEFCFPLEEGQTVSYFAMEGPQGLQEASVVEKTKGRVVYESVVRKQVDPALLEWTAGNNFRSRIYPIPAKGFKRILIGFNQTLSLSNNSYLYYQPFFFKDKVDVFEVRAEVFRQEVKPELYAAENVTLQFDKWKENWVAEKKIMNYVANKPLSFFVPLNEKTSRVFVEKTKQGNSSFYFTVEPKAEIFEKKIPDRIVLFWDISGSSEKSDTKSILECLDSYIKKAAYPSIKLIMFNNEITDVLPFKGGKKGWESAVEKIKLARPDGATQLGCIDLSKYKPDEFILVSDGLNNFGKHEIITSDKPLYTICSSPSADYSYLKYLSVITGGSFVNLSAVNQSQALNLLSTYNYQFISAEYDKNVIRDVFPSKPVTINGSFSMAGFISGASSDIILNFGIGDKILNKQKITIVNEPGEFNNMVPKMWAQIKLAEMDVFHEKNKNEITALAKEYGLVSRNTSLLILDNIQDYLTYKVEPADPKMKAEYFKKLNEIKIEFVKEKKTHLEEVIAQFGEWIKWYDSKYTRLKKPLSSQDTSGSLPSLSNQETASDSTSMPVSGRLSMHFTSPPPPPPGLIYDVSLQNYNGASVYSWSHDLNPDYRYKNSESRNGEINVGAWEPDAEYIRELKKTNRKGLYQKYLSLKPKYQSTPSFFIDVSDYFLKQGEEKLALRILSNIAELELENHQLLRVLAHRLQQLNKNELAINVFEDVLKIREEEPQSYRDLGLAYEQNKEYQKAADVLCKVVNRKWDSRFPEVECLVACEINHLISISDTKLRLDSLDKKLIKPMPCDIRVVINWDTDNCDMDLWVTDPDREKCFFSYPLTISGGKMTRDFTGGYGPEVFMIKKASKGNYKVEVNFFGNHNQSITGLTTVQAEIYTNYGLASESKKVVTLRLETNKEVISLADVAFK